MAGIKSPQNQAGITSFYDAQVPGPKLDPKLALAVIIIFVVIVIVITHFSYYG